MIQLFILLAGLCVLSFIAWQVFCYFQLDANDRQQTAAWSPSRVFILFVLPLFVATAFIVTQQEQLDDIIELHTLESQWLSPVNDFYTNGVAFKEAEKVSSGDLLRLTQRYLQKNSQDHAAWYQLASSYMRAKQPEPAVMILRRALDLAPNNTDYQVTYAQALVASPNAQGAQQANDILSKLLQQKPEHQMALMTQAFALEKMQDNTAALKAWQTLRTVQLDAKGQAMPYVEQKIQQLSGGSPEIAAKQPARKGLAQINITVSDELAPRANNGVLFVIIKEQGMPMPVAVKRIANPSLPISVDLSDANNLSPQRKLSELVASKKPLEVLARYSFAGKAGSQAGDFYSEAVSFKNTLSINIAQVVK